MNTTIAELRRLEAEATPGPWDQAGLIVYDTCMDAVCTGNSSVDSTLIVAMRNALPELLNALECPVGWAYELAKLINEDGTYTGWGKSQISSILPRVPDGSIRNIRPLFALPPHGGRDDD